MADLPKDVNPIDRVTKVEDRFISEWGRMSSSWGINRTMAQIHALLFITSRPHSVEEIMERLQISRGNASMNLRDLMDWGIVQRSRERGSRKDLYGTEYDAWAMVARVVRERKRRELDPTKSSLEDCLNQLPKENESEQEQQLRTRINSLLGVFHAVDAISQQVLQTDEAFYETLKLFARES